MRKKADLSQSDDRLSGDDGRECFFTTDLRRLAQRWRYFACVGSSPFHSTLSDVSWQVSRYADNIQLCGYQDSNNSARYDYHSLKQSSRARGKLSVSTRDHPLRRAAPWIMLIDVIFLELSGGVTALPRSGRNSSLFYKYLRREMVVPMVRRMNPRGHIHGCALPV